MSTSKLNEHVEQELFNKGKRVTIDPEKVIKTTPKIIKESVLGISEDKPVKKKRPYYRKKYNKPTPVEVITSEPFKINAFVKGLLVGLIISGVIITIVNLLN